MIAEVVTLSAMLAAFAGLNIVCEGSRRHWRERAGKAEALLAYLNSASRPTATLPVPTAMVPTQSVRERFDDSSLTFMGHCRVETMDARTLEAFLKAVESGEVERELRAIEALHAAIDTHRFDA
jgi:hypothetical protein